MTNHTRPRFAMMWGASCGGCEVSVLNLAEKILELDKVFEVVFWPMLADFKYEDLRGYADRSIDLCLLNGAIRNSEDEEMARLLRQKARILVAFGACANSGGVPALANLSPRQAIFEAAYLDNPTTQNLEGCLPRTAAQVPEGELLLPHFNRTVKSAVQVVDVDYFIPGCPPEAPQIWSALERLQAAILEGAPFPPKGAVLGASSLALCSECPLERHDKQIDRFLRSYELEVKPGICLLDQGLACLGPSTRGGCGALCPQAGIACSGCYGGLEGVEDQGSHSLSALASVIEAGSPQEAEPDLEREVSAAMDTLVDPAGTFYRYSLAQSLLHASQSSAHDKAVKG